MVGLKIKAMREQAGHSQKELAKLLGVSRTSVTAWENGTSGPSASFLNELANLYGRSVDYILGRDDIETIAISHLSEDQKELIMQLWRYLSKEQSAN